MLFGVKKKGKFLDRVIFVELENVFIILVLQFDDFIIFFNLDLILMEDSDDYNLYVLDFILFKDSSIEIQRIRIRKFKDNREF